MEQRLKDIRREALASLENASTPEEIEETRVRYLGRKGLLTEILRSISTLPPEQKPVVGREGNILKNDLEEAIARKSLDLEEARQEAEFAAFFDPTLPGIPRRKGTVHPIARVQKRIVEVASSMGFLVLDGPEVENEFYNFEAVNIPRHHPARDTMDTFWMKDGNLLRTHTSSVQVRAMKKYGAPIKCIVPGRVFRYEVTDASHENTFNQVEGLMVDEGVSMANMLAVMREMVKAIFGGEVEVRLRPGYFPFVEPGIEMDISCILCKGAGCPMCSRTGWVEMVGAGMVHPNVLRAGGVDPEKYSGFAFGFGLDRLVIMRYQIDDIRHFLGGDLRFLEQF